MDIESFKIEGAKADQVIIELLIDISARQRAMEHYVFSEKAENEENYKDAISSFDKNRTMEREVLCKYLYTYFSDVRDLLPPDIGPATQ